MKASELRIGNLIQARGGAGIVRAIFGIDVLLTDQITDEEWQPEVENCTGIPLTEEWLIKFGFERSDSINKSPSFFFKYVGGSELHINPENGVVWIERRENVFKFNNPVLIEYVHQLQNLYFALTGEELTVKES